MAIPYGKEHGLDVEGCDAIMFVKKTESGINYFLAFENNTKPDIIAHECFHFVNELFSHKGIIPDTENDEPGAYLMGWIVEECFKCLTVKPK